MSDYKNTISGNRVSRSAVLKGTERILINGNCTIEEHALLNGDVDIEDEKSSTYKSSKSDSPSISLGRYCYLGRRCQITPTMVNGCKKYGPIEIGSFTIVGNDTLVKSSRIGSRVLIEDKCIISNDCIVYDCSFICSGTIIPPGTIVAPYSKVTGRPGLDFNISPLHNSYKKLIEHEARFLQTNEQTCQ